MSFSPPSPPSPSPEFHFPVIAIALIGITATGILLISYYVFVIKCCLHLHRVDALNRLFYRRRDLDDGASPATAAVPGLDDAVIRSIPVIKFRKSSAGRRKYAVAGVGDGDNDGDNQSGIECAVCLSEFEDGEKIRVIPNCCHGFHIDCIDIWLQNSANCPLCRTPISASSVINNSNIVNDKFCNDNISSSSSNCSSINNDDNFSGNDDDYVVIEIQGNNLDEPRLIPPRTNSRQQREEIEATATTTKKLKHVYSMGDELIDSMRKKDEEFEVQPIRRSISMDLSSNTDFCIEMQKYGKNCDENAQVNAVINRSSEINSNNNGKVKKSIFTFGYGRTSKGSIQPIQLDLDP